MGHTIRMEYRRLKRHLGRQMWILGREYEMSAVETSCTPPPSLIDQPSRSHFLLSLSLSLSIYLSRCWGPRLSRSKASKQAIGLLFSLTSIELAIVGNHKHDFPFEDVVADETATYAGDVLVALHLLELAAQEPGGC